MMVTNSISLIDFLREHQVLQPTEIEALAEELPALEDNPRVVTDMLLSLGWLSTYQAQRLLDGDGETLLLGPYVLMESLGEGGMGHVFKARHIALDRIDAVKIIRQEHLARDPEAVRRFQREARAASLLRHPNVVTVYESGCIDDQYYMAMQYLEGRDLARLVKEKGPLAVAQAFNFMRQATLGLQHAHEHGMVHRDIKPSNLMATLPPGSAPKIAAGVETIPCPPPEETPQGRHVWLEQIAARAKTPDLTEAVIKILDMGLVRVLGTGPGQASQVSLTQEGSMVGTPEYIAPEQAINAHRVDIRADIYSLGCTFYYLLTEKPPFHADTALETLLRHQMDEAEPVEKLRPDLPALLVAIIRKMMAKRPMDRYDTPNEVIKALDQLSADSLSTVPPPRAESQQPDQASGDLTPTTSMATPPVYTAAEPTPPAAPAIPIAASLYHWAPQEETEKTSLVPSIPAKRLLKLQGHQGCVTAVGFTPSRDVLVSSGVDGKVRLWDFSSKMPRERPVLKSHKAGAHSVAFTTDSKRMATGSGGLDGMVWLWDLAEDQPDGIAVLAGHKGPVAALAFDSYGKKLASGGSDRTVRVWDVVGPNYVSRAIMKGHTDAIKSVAFSLDGKWLASGGQDRTVRLWSEGRMWFKELAILAGHEGHVNCVAFTPDGSTLVSGSQDETIRLWDLKGGSPKLKLLLEGHSSPIRAVQVTPNGRLIASLDEGGTVCQWDAETGIKVMEYLVPKSLWNSFALTFDARYLAIGASDGPVHVYRLGEKSKKVPHFE